MSVRVTVTVTRIGARRNKQADGGGRRRVLDTGPPVPETGDLKFSNGPNHPVDQIIP